MKILSKMIATIMLSLVIATASYSSIIVNNIDVGEVDTLLSVSNLANSSVESESFWVSSVLGEDVTFVIKEATIDYFDTNVENVYAFESISDSDYFIVKNANMSALYSNNALLSWGVFDVTVIDIMLLNLDFESNLPNSDYTISHVSAFGDSISAVPEPTSLLLLGLGLVGFVGVKKFTK